MALRNRFKEKGKKVAVALALGASLLGLGYTKENPTTNAPTKENTEETTKNKFVISVRPEVDYFNEYVEAVKSGKNEEQAYREFALKIANGNTKPMLNILITFIILLFFLYSLCDNNKLKLTKTKQIIMFCAFCIY